MGACAPPVARFGSHRLPLPLPLHAWEAYLDAIALSAAYSAEQQSISDRIRLYEKRYYKHARMIP
jgi:hypothetical protein